MNVLVRFSVCFSLIAGFLSAVPFLSSAHILSETSLSTSPEPDPLPAGRFDGQSVKNNGSAFTRAASGFSRLYSDRALLYFLGIAGIMANTHVDETLRSAYSRNVRSGETDELSRFVKPIGNGRRTFFVYPAVYIAGKYMIRNETMTVWSENAFLSALLSLPGLLASQFVLGGSRPSDDRGESKWHFFRDNNSASGHTWVAAIPFITAARMTRSGVAKSVFYVLSTLTGISRINDDQHYSSQVILGYAWALLSVNTVMKHPAQSRKIRVSPQVGAKEVLLTMRISF